MSIHYRWDEEISGPFVIKAIDHIRMVRYGTDEEFARAIGCEVRTVRHARKVIHCQDRLDDEILETINRKPRPNRSSKNPGAHDRARQALIDHPDLSNQDLSKLANCSTTVVYRARLILAQEKN